MRQPLRIRPWVLVSAAWIVPALLGALDQLAQQRIWGQPHDVRAVLFTAIDWLLYGAITPFVFVLASRFPLTRPRLGRNVLVHLVAALVFCAVWASGGTLLKVVLQPKSLPMGVPRFWVSWVFTTLPFGVAVYLAVVGVEHGVRYFVQARERDTQVARLSEQLTNARLSSLQAQLNPHFLFNSLNTVAVLVRDGARDEAARVVEQLSGVLRRTLSRSREQELPLADELALIRQYLAVEQARFSDRLRPEFDIAPDTESAAVPGFALQHLVENAIRHGIAQRTDAGRVAIATRRVGDALDLTVTDDGPGIPTNVEQPGHGIANTRERLQALYGPRASLDVTRIAGGTVARMRIPYRRLDSSSNA